MTDWSAGPAIVFGATGYTGRHVVAELARLGVPTHAHVRPGNSRRASWIEHFEGLGAHVDGTAWEPEAIARTLRDLDPRLAFGLLGTTRSRARSDGQGYDAVDVGMTMMVVDALHALGADRDGHEGHDQPRRFVYLSSRGAGPGARGAYLAARAKVETELNARRGRGFESVIARPSFISGPDREDRPGERFAARVVDGLTGALAALRIRGPAREWASLSGEQLGVAIAQLALREDAANRVFEAGQLRHEFERSRGP